MLENDELRDKGAIFVKGTVAVKRSMLTAEGCLWLDRDITDRASKPSRIGDSKQNVVIVAELFGFPIYNRGELTSCSRLAHSSWSMTVMGCFTIVTRDQSVHCSFPCSEKLNHLFSQLKINQYFYVVSMQVHAYRLSRDYMAKHTLLDTIASIIAANKASPRVNRTPRWLVSKYLQQEGMRGVLDEEAEEDCKTHTPRYVHRAEVYSVLAKYRHQIRERIGKEAQKLDSLSWQKFCALVDSMQNAHGITRMDCNELEEQWPEIEEVVMEEPPMIEPVMEDEPNFSSTVRIFFSFFGQFINYNACPNPF